MDLTTGLRVGTVGNLKFSATSKRLDQQNAPQAPTFSKNYGSYLRHSKSQPLPQPKPEFVPPAGIIQNESPKSILKKQSAYENPPRIMKPEVPQPHPVSSVSNAMAEEQVDEEEALKSVNVSAARQMFANQSTTYVKAPVPEPEVKKPAPEITKSEPLVDSKPISKIPVPKQRTSSGSQSNTKPELEPEVIEEKRLEPDSDAEMAWDNDEFDLVGASANHKPSFAPRQAPEDFVEEEKMVEPETQPAELSDSEESMAVDEPSPPGPKNEPDAQSLLSMQSITLTDSVDLQNLAMKHFANESKSDDEVEHVIPVSVINTPPTAVRSKKFDNSRAEVKPKEEPEVEAKDRYESSTSPRFA